MKLLEGVWFSFEGGRLLYSINFIYIMIIVKEQKDNLKSLKSTSFIFPNTRLEVLEVLSRFFLMISGSYEGL